MQLSKASGSISVTLSGRETTERDLQNPKAYSSIEVTEFGIAMDTREEQSSKAESNPRRQSCQLQ